MTKATTSTKIEGLYISPFSYLVQEDDQLSAKANCLGACMPDLTTILMDPNQSPEVYLETLFHEALHAIWTQTALDKKYDDDMEEEEVIYSLSPRLVAFLRDNRKFLKELTR